MFVFASSENSPSCHENGLTEVMDALLQLFVCHLFHDDWIPQLCHCCCLCYLLFVFASIAVLLTTLTIFPCAILIRRDPPKCTGERREIVEPFQSSFIIICSYITIFLCINIASTCSRALSTRGIKIFNYRCGKH